MHGFIVRPFGTKNGIDFDRVEAELIRPALDELGVSGGTTGEFIQQGNIRADMFEQLLVADLVVADISIHNANAFYELGIRHAFRDKRTLLIRSKGDEVPFDLKTDRYFSYDAGDLAASVPLLVNALKATLDSQAQDSPVFQLLPGLQPTDPSSFQVVPLDFREEVHRAKSSRNRGFLQMMCAEAGGFPWTSMAWRLIGQAQFELKDWPGAQATWEAVRKYDDTDLQANKMLGNVYQRLGDLVGSDQSLQRALQHTRLVCSDRAEIRALMARNAKTLWEADWRDLGGLDAVQQAALSSPLLERSLELYAKAFVEDRNHFYSGLNALAMATITKDLAAAQPEIWEEGFESEAEAALKLRELEVLCGDLKSGVKLGLESRQTALAREDETDLWADVSVADLSLLGGGKPGRVGRAYKRALAGAPDFATASAREQITLYRSLGILAEGTQAALENIPVVEHAEREEPPRVILFTGHRIDAPDRPEPRFPRAKEEEARALILAAVAREKEKATGRLLGLCGGACGGDILFHEVCHELEIPTKIYLALPKRDYIKASVADGGPDWVERLKHLTASRPPEILSDAAELPRWLRAKKGYGIWQRSNLWMLHSALAISRDNLTLIALWNGEAGDGPGGTADMVQRATDRGATFIHLDTRALTT